MSFSVVYLAIVMYNLHNKLPFIQQAKEKIPFHFESAFDVPLQEFSAVVVSTQQLACPLG